MSTFGKKVISAVAGLAVVSSIVSPIAGVSAAMSGVDAANELALLGVIVDQSANPADYELGNNLKRGEGVKVMMNLSPVAVVDNCEGKFEDLAASNWVCKYAETALANNMVAPNDNFRPDDMVSKIEGLKMVFQARGLERGENTDWRAGYVNSAVEMGVADSAFMDYNTAVTRGEMFVWAVNAIKANDNSVTDGNDFLCEILGGDNCDTVEPTEPTEPTTPVEPTEPTTPTTGGTATLSLSPESPTNGLAAAGTPRVAMLTFDVTAGSSDVTLNEVKLLHVGLGDRNNVDDVAIYNSMNERVSKQRDFKNNDLDLSFDRGTVVEAGKTQSFTVAATLERDLAAADQGQINTTYQVELVSLDASASVSGAGITGAALTPTIVSNAGEIAVTDDTVSDTITVGDQVRLAGFTIEETKDNEDVLIKTITLHQKGSIDPEYINDIVVTVDGNKVEGNFMVNDDDELVMNLDYTLASDKKARFLVKGVITGDVSKTVEFEFEGADDVYAVGAASGFNIRFESAAKTPAGADADNLSAQKTVEGAEIDVVFDRSDIDETRTDRDDILLGTLKLTANTNDYEVKKVKVEVEGVAAAIDDLQLGGNSYDGNPTVVGTKTVYTFEDILLTKGKTETMNLEVDIKEERSSAPFYNGQSLDFTVVIAEVEDDENNITYTSSSTPSLNTVLSTTALTSKKLDIEAATFKVSQTRVNDRQLVLANGLETVLYKAKIYVGDSENVSVEDIVLKTNSPEHTATLEVDDVVADAILNIGGKTYSGDVYADRVEFTSINHKIIAGSDNVEVLVTGKLKDDTLTGSPVLALELDSAKLRVEDSEGDDLPATSVTTIANNATTGQKTLTTLREEGLFKIKVVNDPETDDNLENTVLAGNNGVVLAELEMEAEYEDMDVEVLKLSVAGDFSSTIASAKLMAGSKTIAEGGVVEKVGANTHITFENFMVKDADDLIDVELVADLNIYTGEGDQTSADLGNIVVSLDVASLDVEGANSNNDVLSTASKRTAATNGTTNGETVSVVPVMVTATVADTLGGDDKYAKAKFAVDYGNNDIDYDDVYLSQIEFEAINGVIEVRNGTDESLVLTTNNATPIVVNTTTSANLSLAKVNNNDNFEFKVVNDPEELRVKKNGFRFFIDLNDNGTAEANEVFQSSGDNVLNLGEYNDN